MSEYERITTHSAKGLKLKKGKKFVELLADKALTLKALNRLAELEDEIETNALVKLLFKYQDEVWVVEKVFDYEHDCFTGEWKIRQVRCLGMTTSWGKLRVLEDVVNSHNLENVFATRKEAEIRRKELAGEK